MKEITRLWLKGGYSFQYTDNRGYSGNYTSFDKTEEGSAWKSFECKPEVYGVRLSHPTILDCVIPWHKVDFYWERDVVVKAEAKPAEAKKGADAPKVK